MNLFNFDHSQWTVSSRIKSQVYFLVDIPKQISLLDMFLYLFPFFPWIFCVSKPICKSII